MVHILQVGTNVHITFYYPVNYVITAEVVDLYIQNIIRIPGLNQLCGYVSINVFFLFCLVLVLNCVTRQRMC